MALVVAAGGAVAAVVLALASDALAAAFALLLGGFVAESAVAVGVADSAAHVSVGSAIGGRRYGRDLAGALDVAAPVLGLHRARPNFSPLLFPAVDADRPRSRRRVENRRHWILEVGVMKLRILLLDDGEHSVMGMTGRGWKRLNGARAQKLYVPLVDQLLLEGRDLARLNRRRDERVADRCAMGMGRRQRGAQGVKARQACRRRVRHRGRRERRQGGQLRLRVARRRELTSETRQDLATGAAAVLRLPGPVLARENDLAARVDQTTGQALVVVPGRREPEAHVVAVQCRQRRAGVHRTVTGEAAEGRQMTTRVARANRARRGRNRRRRAHPLGGDGLLRDLGAHLLRRIL